MRILDDIYDIFGNYATSPPAEPAEVGKGFIYASELSFIARHTLDSPSCETGGDLFGYWTHEGYPIVAYVIGPGKKANRQVTFFNQDEAYLVEAGRALNREHGLQHIGNWHSHHRLGLASPSAHDSATVKRAIENYRLAQFFLVISSVRQTFSPFERTASVNGFLYRAGQEKPIEMEWLVLPGESPIRAVFDEARPELVARPKTKVAAYSDDLRLASFDEPEEVAFQDSSYWLNDEANQRLLKAFLDELEKRYAEAKPTQEDDGTVSVEFSVEARRVRLNFGAAFPQSAPTLTLDDEPLPNLPDWSATLSVEALLDFVANALQPIFSNATAQS